METYNPPHRGSWRPTRGFRYADARLLQPPELASGTGTGDGDAKQIRVDSHQVFLIGRLARLVASAVPPGMLLRVFDDIPKSVFNLVLNSC